MTSRFQEPAVLLEETTPTSLPPDPSMIERMSNFLNRNPFVDDWDAQLHRINLRKKVLFDDLGPLDVRLMRMGKAYEKPKKYYELVNVSEKQTSVLRSCSEIELEEHLRMSSEDDFRIFSFCQAFSLAPLMCSKEAMLAVVQDSGFSSMFVDVLIKFGDQPQIFQESSGFRNIYRFGDGSFELCYQFMYIERNGRQPPRDPWSFRQTGVVHSYSVKKGVNQVILLHPNSDAIAQTTLENHAESQTSVLSKHPLAMHLVIISSYLCNWQEYLECLAGDLEQIRRRIDVVEIDGPDSTLTINPELLQTLRHLEDKIVCKACRCLNSTDALVRTLITINTDLGTRNPSFSIGSRAIQQELHLAIYRLQSSYNTAGILARRVQATLGLLTNLLDLSNQHSSGEISTRILRLTQEGVDDNATVKVITILTLIYLPASFMASFLGMNLFDYKGEDGSLQASPQFWIFFVTTVPLTMLTVGAWYLYKNRHNRIRKARCIEQSV